MTSAYRVPRSRKRILHQSEVTTLSPSVTQHRVTQSLPPSPGRWMSATDLVFCIAASSAAGGAPVRRMPFNRDRAPQRRPTSHPNTHPEAHAIAPSTAPSPSPTLPDACDVNYRFHTPATHADSLPAPLEVCVPAFPTASYIPTGAALVPGDRTDKVPYLERVPTRTVIGFR